MAMSKIFLFAGTALLLSVYGTTGSPILRSDDTSLQAPQSVIIDAGLIARQGNMQDSCFAAGCHQAFDVQDVTSTHKPFADGKCEHCHAPASHLQQVSSSPDDEIALCTECHSVESLGYSHPAGENVIDPTTGAAITCNTCHTAHYSDKANLLELDGRGELCLHCHVKFINNSR